MLKIITGTMFAGKTKYLISKIEKYSVSKKKIVYVSHKNDLMRSSNDKIFTNDKNLNELKNVDIVFINDFINLDSYDYIFIDEFQFFKNTKNFILSLLKKKKIIYIAGLNSNYKQEKWGEIIDLIPYCNKIKLLHSFCHDCIEKSKNRNAIFTVKRNNIKEDVEIGGDEIYKTLCYKCYNN